jgi:hypothetical protein
MNIFTMVQFSQMVPIDVDYSNDVGLVLKEKQIIFICRRIFSIKKFILSISFSDDNVGIYDLVKLFRDI